MLNNTITKIKILYLWWIKPTNLITMMDDNALKWYSMSDPAILEALGTYIQKTRIEKNKTQQELSQQAGINRSTLVQIEKGGGANLLSFIQVLRALEQLQLLQAFEKQIQISPLKLAALAQKQRMRASSKRGIKDQKSKTDW
jgi:DNA-binding XRE family transcriptional regulator